jgi:hypothetical protein
MIVAKKKGLLEHMHHAKKGGRKRTRKSGRKASRKK